MKRHCILTPYCWQKKTDTQWVDFWKSSFEGEWIDKNGKKIAFEDLLKIDELHYLKKQFSNALAIKQSLIPENIILIDPKDFENKINYQYYKISTPAFTKDGEFCLIYLEDVCVMDCGGGGFLIYKINEDKVWERFASKYLWMS